MADAGTVKRVYQAGLNMGGDGGLRDIPVFDMGSYNDTSGYHYQWYRFAIRERLRQSNGDVGNHVEAWGELMCTAVGLEPVPEGVTALPSRRGQRGER